MKIIFILLVCSLSVVNSQSIEIKNAWIRPGAEGMNTAMYFNIVNSSKKNDTLYKSECNVSNVVELHETYKSGDMMGMRKISSIVVKGKTTFKFEPGGNHVMLIDLKKKIKVGEKYDAFLFFRKAGKIKVSAIVKK